MRRSPFTRMMVVASTTLLVMLAACGDDDPTEPDPPDPVDPDLAPVVAVDRFSDDAGNLFVRSANSSLPGPDEPIDFDQAPFLVNGLGPDGEIATYYNFDVQSTTPAPIYVLFREGESQPVEGQLNIIDVIPGDEGYNDFWQVTRVTVPSDYVANTVTSFAQIQSAGYPMEATSTLVNCPVVPQGSTADLNLNGSGNDLIRGWYQDQVVFYFSFTEAAISTTPSGEVPRSPIWVSFNINPDQPDGGPPSGFMTEPGTSQTHNILATLPDDSDYSPLWHVNIYDNADFDLAFDRESVADLTILAEGAAHVNCPVVAIDEDGVNNPDRAESPVIDRFSDEAGNLFRRSANADLPGPDEPIDFDQAPFITDGLGPDGQLVSYYNFDVQATEPAPIYVLFREGQDMPVRGQLNIIDVIPGDEGYNDFWEVTRVTVPADYVANTVTSFEQIQAAGYPMQATGTLVNCPVVPDGSTAELRFGQAEETGLIRGWYQDQVVFYFAFTEAPISTTAENEIPRSPIWVSFNTNPGEPGGGPPSGFMTEEGTSQTHNIVATLPGDDTYSPYWHVNIYDNADFDLASDLESVADLTILAEGAAHVNCPVVAVTDTRVRNPNTAETPMIDRFSDEAGNLFRRSANADLPGPNVAIDFDQAPFITDGLGPDGQLVSYYNFDVQATEPAPIYVLFREGQDAPVRGQLNIIDVIPGEEGYNDFWQVVRVTVPADYVANTVTSFEQIQAAGYPMQATGTLVNCPVVPDGSTAELRFTEGEEQGLIRGWYQDQVVYYFSFTEAPIEVTAEGEVPRSPIWVAFNVNPGEPGGGPPSGFMTESGSAQTHNVVATVPGDDGYSPYWHVNIYDNADFDMVTDLSSAMAASILAEGAAHVNCPIVMVR